MFWTGLNYGSKTKALGINYINNKNFKALFPLIHVLFLIFNLYRLFFQSLSYDKFGPGCGAWRSLKSQFNSTKIEINRDNT